jgi:hypothetical protein
MVVTGAADSKLELAREKESQVAIRKKITEESKTTGRKHQLFLQY